MKPFRRGIRLLALLVLAASAPAAPAPPVPDPGGRLKTGVELYRERRYLEAMDEFLAVLEAQPGHPEALDYQKRVLAAALSERILAARTESFRMMQEALDRSERGQIASRLVKEADRALHADRLAAANELFLKARDLDPGLPQAARGLAECRRLVRQELARLGARQGAGAFPGRRDGLEGLLSLDDGRFAEAANHLQQALFLTDPKSSDFGDLRESLQRAQSGFKPSPARAPVTSAPPAVPAPTETSRPLAPPSMPPASAAPVAAPAEPSAIETKAKPRKSRPKKRQVRRRRVLPVPVSAVAATPVPAAVAATPVPLEAPAPALADPEASNGAYLEGVTAYMAGRVDEARKEMQRALELDPGNERAKKMLERMEREARTK